MNNRTEGRVRKVVGVVFAVGVLATATTAPARDAGLPRASTNTVVARTPELFDYDRSAPLEVAWGRTVVLHDIAHRDLKFIAARRARVAAYFVHPLAGAPWPLVIWTPGRGEDRSENLGDAAALARKGVASLLVDPPAPEVVTCDATKDLANFTGYVVGRRRAVDLALTLPNVDGKRIAAAGFSYGASVTAVLAGVEHRIRAFALKSGRAHHTGFMRLACSQLGEKKLDAYVEKLSAVDPVKWVPKATGPAFLIQDGARDPFNPRADVLALYRAAHGPKVLRLYAADHPLNAAATAYRARWLLRELRR
jgi:dienelactone hydrolase